MWKATTNVPCHSYLFNLFVKNSRPQRYVPRDLSKKLKMRHPFFYNNFNTESTLL